MKWSQSKYSLIYKLSSGYEWPMGGAGGRNSWCSDRNFPWGCQADLESGGLKKRQKNVKTLSDTQCGSEHFGEAASLKQHTWQKKDLLSLRRSASPCVSGVESSCSFYYEKSWTSLERVCIYFKLVYLVNRDVFIQILSFLVCEMPTRAFGSAAVLRCTSDLYSPQMIIFSWGMLMCSRQLWLLIFPSIPSSYWMLAISIKLF